MRITRLIKVLIAVFAALAGINIYFSWLAGWANNEKSMAHEARHIFTLATHELRTASLELSRISRAYIVTGDAFQSELYWEELQVIDRVGSARRTFVEYGAPENEMHLFDRALAVQAGMRVMDLRAMEARASGDYDLALGISYSDEYEALGFAFLGYLEELNAAIRARTQETVDAATGNAGHFGNLARVATILFGIISVLGALAVLRELKATRRRESEANEINEIFLGASPFIMNIWNDTPTLVSTSDQSVKMFGLSDKKQYIERFGDLSPECQPCGMKSGEKAINFVKQALREGRVQFEWMHQTLNGDPVPSEITLVRFARRGRNFVAAYTVDLRPIKAAMERERDANELNKMFFDSAPFVMTIWDDNFDIVSTSKQVTKIFGVSPELYLQRFYDLSPDRQPCGTPSVKKAHDYFKQTFREGFAQFEWMHKTISGEPLPMEITCVRFEYRGQHMLMSFANDLRLVKTAMEGEREANEFNKMFFNHAPLIFNLWDEDMNLVDANRQALDLFQIPSKEEYLTTYRDYWAEYQPCGMLSTEKAAGLIKEAFGKGRVRFEWMHVMNGEPLPTEVILVRFSQQGKYMVAAYITDLRPVKAAMEVERQREIGERTRLILDAAPMAVNLYDAGLSLIDCNMEAVRMFGFGDKETCAKALGARFLELSPRFQPCGMSSSEKAKQMAARAVSFGRFQDDWTHLTVAGEDLPAKVTVVRIPHQDTFLLVSYVQDLREIKAAQEMERESFELTQMILDSAPFVVGLWNDRLQVISASMHATEMFEIADPQMLANRLFDFSPELQPCGTPSPEKAAEDVGRAYKEGYSKFEWTHQTSGGEPLPAEVICKRFKRKGRDMLVSYTRDLREVKAAQEKEREAHEMVTMLLDASPVFIEIWDDRLNLVDCNSQFMNLYGLSSKEEFLRRYDDLSPEYQPCGTPSKGKIVGLLVQALREGLSRSEWMHFTADGDELPVEVTFVRLVIQGKYILAGYNHDLRQVKKAMSEMRSVEIAAEAQRREIAEEKNRAKSELLAKVSHDIREPMNAIIGMAELALRDEKMKDAREHILTVKRAGTDLLSIINDMPAALEEWPPKEKRPKLAARNGKDEDS